MNALIYWQFGVNNDAFKNLLEGLNVSYCAYFYEYDEDKIYEGKLNIKTESLYAYNDLNYYLKNINNLLPLDDTIIQSMKEYEMTTMDIIFRWRRSITTTETYKEIRNLYFIYLKFWNDFIISRNIEFVYFAFEPHIPSTYMIYALCKVYNIPIIIQKVMTVIENRKLNYCMEVSLDKLDYDFERRLNENINKYDNNDINIELKPELKMYFDQYSQNNANIKRVIWQNEKLDIFYKIKEYFNRARVYMKQSNYKILINKMKYIVKAKYVSSKLLKYIKKLEVNPNYNDKYIFFPLHLQPECTTLPCGGVFVDQLMAITMISKKLPNGVKLYVKEHPAYWAMNERRESMTETRSKEYYNKIIELNNVKLIDHRVNSLELLDKCCAVVTVTGTAGFEALFKNKPVMLFGNAFYSLAPGVFKIGTNEECESAIKKIFDENICIEKRNIEIFLKTLEINVVTYGEDVKVNVDNGMPVDYEDYDKLAISVVNFSKLNYPNLYKNNVK